MKVIENVPIFHVQTNNLDLYTTTKADRKTGRSRLPLPNQRIEEEDRYDEVACAAMRARKVTQPALQAAVIHQFYTSPVAQAQSAPA